MFVHTWLQGLDTGMQANGLDGEGGDEGYGAQEPPRMSEMLWTCLAAPAASMSCQQRGGACTVKHEYLRAPAFVGSRALGHTVVGQSHTHQVLTAQTESCLYCASTMHYTQAARNWFLHLSAGSHAVWGSVQVKTCSSKFCLQPQRDRFDNASKMAQVSYCPVSQSTSHTHVVPEPCETNEPA
jgi:hypothetical protein